MDLTTAAAIVTGGAGGVGSATVRRRAQIGATVVIVIVLPRFVTARYSDDWKDAGNMGALRLQLLGSPQVWCGDRLLAFTTRKSLALLAYLATQPGMQPAVP